ncbi:MAG: glycoside hydrolase family 43 protein [Lachnospiraceae bacterium]|nr:glycoside hydrolase family 43 protein [Lachnospiraceae bacterium]
MSTVKNPILSGFYPDPSICRVGDSYYIVNSTFAYFPGVPVFESRDLQHFHQIGNVLTRDSQLPLGDSRMSQGIFAPTIRFHEGVFYMITTNVSHGGNFIVTAENPAGPWSEPHYLKGAEGIDPSLFFDDDGKCYYIGTRPNPDGVRYNGDWYIYIQELDLDNFCLVGDYTLAWKGAMRDAEWPEGPHLYKKDGYYYIMHAEGGTGPAHAVCVARSRDIVGPYVGNFNNPILTHRHLGKNYPIRYVGHADLVDTPDGEWYMVMLASRPCEWYTGLGRETFLAKVTWEDGWPVVNDGVGILNEFQQVGLPEVCELPENSCYTFHTRTLDPHFVTVRNPKPDMYELAGNGSLILKTSPETITEKTNASYLGIRQKSYHYTVRTELRFRPEDAEEAGLVLLQSEEASVRFVVAASKGQTVLRIVSFGDRLSGESGEGAGSEESLSGKSGGANESGSLPEESALPERFGEIRAEKALTQKTETLTLAVMQNGQQLTFWYAQEDGRFERLGPAMDARFLSTEAAGGFVGNTVGMYTSSNHTATDNRAEFFCFCME